MKCTYFCFILSIDSCKSTSTKEDSIENSDEIIVGKDKEAVASTSPLKVSHEVMKYIESCLGRF